MGLIIIFLTFLQKLINSFATLFPLILLYEPLVLDGIDLVDFGPARHRFKTVGLAVVAAQILMKGGHFEWDFNLKKGFAQTNKYPINDNG